MHSILQNKVQELITLCERYNVRRTYVFGSVRTTNFSEDSDIDFLISFSDISPEEYADNYFELHYKLEEIFQRPIDLVTEGSLSNPFFIKALEETKQLIYAA